MLAPAAGCAVARGRHAADVVGDLLHVLEDVGDLRARVPGDAVDVADDLADLGAVLLHRLVELLGDVGEVLEDRGDLLLALVVADAGLEGARDRFHVLQDLGDLALQGLDRGLVDVVGDLALVGDARAAFGAGGEDDQRLADEAGGALANGRVVEEDELGLHLDVDARHALLEREPVDDADLDARDEHARARGDAGHVGEVGVDAVAVLGAGAGGDEAEPAIGGAR